MEGPPHGQDPWSRRLAINSSCHRRQILDRGWRETKHEAQRDLVQGLRQQHFSSRSLCLFHCSRIVSCLNDSGRIAALWASQFGIKALHASFLDDVGESRGRVHHHLDRRSASGPSHSSVEILVHENSCKQGEAVLSSASSVPHTCAMFFLGKELQPSNSSVGTMRA